MIDVQQTIFGPALFGPRLRARLEALNGNGRHAPAPGQVTIGITAFRRPDCLRRIVQSVRRFYPDIPIIVADNGDQPVEFHDARLTYLTLPFNSGVSAARNALIDALETDYLFLSEDDFIFTEETRIEPLMDVLNSDPEVGFVGGMNRLFGNYNTNLQNGEISSYASDLEVFRGELRSTRPTRPIRIANGGTPYRYVDQTWNFGLIRRAMLKDHRWDEMLRVAEHFDWFWSVKQAAKWRVASTEAVVCDHRHEDPADYAPFRRDTTRYLNRATAKAGADRLRLLKAHDLTPEPRGLPNIIVLTVGRSGSSIITRMMHHLGWNPADADAEFAESVEFRDINQAAIGGRFDRSRAERFLAGLPSPWLIKDPRFMQTAEHWLSLLADHQPALLWITRDAEAVLKSHQRQGWKPRLGSVENGMQRCQDIFDRWPWGRFQISHEAIRDAVRMFDVRRGADASPGLLGRLLAAVRSAVWRL